MAPSGTLRQRVVRRPCLLNLAKYFQKPTASRSASPDTPRRIIPWAPTESLSGFLASLVIYPQAGTASMSVATSIRAGRPAVKAFSSAPRISPGVSTRIPRHPRSSATRA